MARVFQPNHFGAAVRWRGKANARRADIRLWQYNHLHTLKHLDATLNLRRLGGLGPKSLNKGLDLFAFAILRFFVGLELCAARLTFAFIIEVPARVTRHHAVLHLQHPIGQRLEQIAVMRNQEQSAGVVAQKTTQPFDSGKVQIIGGFIEQQNVRIADQNAYKFGTHFPAPAERVEGFVKFGLLESQSRKRGFGSRAHFVSAQMFKFCLKIAHALES